MIRSGAGENGGPRVCEVWRGEKGDAIIIPARYYTVIIVDSKLVFFVYALSRLGVRFLR